VEHLGNALSVVIDNSISDHQPIILQWKSGEYRKCMPFKFNWAWFNGPNFNDLVRDVCV